MHTHASCAAATRRVARRHAPAWRHTETLFRGGSDGQMTTTGEPTAWGRATATATTRTPTWSTRTAAAAAAVGIHTTGACGSRVVTATGSCTPHGITTFQYHCGMHAGTDASVHPLQRTHHGAAAPACQPATRRHPPPRTRPCCGMECASTGARTRHAASGASHCLTPTEPTVMPPPPPVGRRHNLSPLSADRPPGRLTRELYSPPTVPVVALPLPSWHPRTGAGGCARCVRDDTVCAS